MLCKTKNRYEAPDCIGVLFIYWFILYSRNKFNRKQMSIYTSVSAIHGSGLFANNPFGKGEQIGIIFTRVKRTGVFKNDPPPQG